MCLRRVRDSSKLQRCVSRDEISAFESNCYETSGCPPSVSYRISVSSAVLLPDARLGSSRTGSPLFGCARSPSRQSLGCEVAVVGRKRYSARFRQGIGVGMYAYLHRRNPGSPSKGRRDSQLGLSEDWAVAVAERSVIAITAGNAGREKGTLFCDMVHSTVGSGALYDFNSLFSRQFHSCTEGKRLNFVCALPP